jgi:DNA-binding NarL/FixJ family response regulator/REP element-mobilizing transposase RayT
MTTGNVKVLIINRQLGFSVRIKQALEQMGGFEVAPFTAPDAALEYLMNHPHDVALVDFTIPGLSGSDLVYMLRQIQPKLAVVASPYLPDVVTEVRNLDVQGIVDVPASAREIAPVLLKAVQDDDEGVPDTVQSTRYEEEETTSLDASDRIVIRAAMPLRDDDERGVADSSDSVEFIIRDSESQDPARLKEHFEHLDEALVEESVDPVQDVFHRLAEEEPPMPGLEDTGTVSDLRTGVTSADLYELAEAIVDSQAQPAQLPPEKEGETEDSSPVRIILESTTDDKSQVSSLDELLQNIERQFPDDVMGVSPLPSWVKDVERYVREPDFLEEALPNIEDQQESSTTRMMDDRDESIMPAEYAAIDHDTESEGLEPELREEVAESGEPVKPIAQPEADLIETPEWVADVDTEELEAQIVNEKQAVEPAASLDTVQAEKEDIGGPGFHAPVDEAELAQMALNLTSASLESTAVAVLLARGSEVVAYSGDLPLEDMAKLHETIAGDWDANPGEARVRFTTLPETGLDYMLYSRRTEDNYTLSMIFEGTLPLRVIRQQSDKILDALTAVPETVEDQIEQEHAVIDELYELEETAAQEEDAATESTEELRLQQERIRQEAVVEEAMELALPTARKPDDYTRYTYLWMLRDPSQSLSKKAAQALVLRLDEWLTSIGWHVEILQVYEDYVYLMADVPDDQPVQEIITELKKFSAQIVSQFDKIADPEQLWADSYGYLEPGRPLTQEEIQQFIGFERM